MQIIIDHFGHENIIQYCNRPFSSVEEMDRVMIENWNNLVDEYDKIYYLGDFTLGGFDVFEEYIKQLNGHINIVPGGHDHRWLSRAKRTEIIYSRTGRVEILPPLYSLDIDVGEDYPETFVLCHYAMKIWDRKHYGSYHLFGHSHGNLKDPEPKSMDVGVDCHNYTPVSIDEIRETLSWCP